MLSCCMHPRCSLNPPPNTSLWLGTALNSLKSAVVCCPSSQAIIPCQEMNLQISDQDPIFFPLSTIIENSVVTKLQTRLLDKRQSMFKSGIGAEAACNNASLQANMVPLRCWFHLTPTACVGYCEPVSSDVASNIFSFLFGLTSFVYKRPNPAQCYHLLGHAGGFRSRWQCQAGTTPLWILPLCYFFAAFAPCGSYFSRLGLLIFMLLHFINEARHRSYAYGFPLH